MPKLPPSTLAALLVLALVTGAARAGGLTAGDWKRNESGWRPFGVGTVVATRTLETMDIPGMAPGRKVVLEEKRTLVAKSATEATVRIERRAGARWSAPTQRTEPLAAPRAGALTPVRGPDGKPVVETIEVEGKPYACTRYTGERPRRGGGTSAPETATLWVHERLGVLKFQGTLPEQGGRRLTWTVERLEVTRKVGGRTLRARQVRVKGRGVRGTILLSGEVPGGTLGHDLEIRSGATWVESRRTLTAFTPK